MIFSFITELGFYIICQYPLYMYSLATYLWPSIQMTTIVEYCIYIFRISPLDNNISNN